MIIGQVTSTPEAMIRFPVRDASGQEQEVEAVIDTGFTEFLMLPPALIAALSLQYQNLKGKECGE